MYVYIDVGSWVGFGSMYILMCGHGLGLGVYIY